MKGRTPSLETRKKISNSLKGKKHTPERIEKSRKSRLGIPAWNKGKTGIYTRDMIEHMRQINLGKIIPKATRDKMSKAQLGKKKTLEHRINMSIARSGSGGSNWRGGITPKNDKVRKGIKYKLWRESVFKRDDWTCQECGQRGGELNADHIKPFSTHEELRFDIDNGRTLCVPCHRKTETYGRNIFKTNTQ